jgi:glycosyltransferase involved in cell wall biosynthesis
LENAVNEKEQQWIPNKTESEKIRFIWGGGISHLPDLQILKTSIEHFDKKILDNIQLYLCGFDLRMTMGNKILKDDPNRSMWGKFESIFTNNYKWIKNSDYLKWLNEYTDITRDLYGYNIDFKNEFYQRRWTKPILLYGTMYNEADVALAPLKSSLFNNMKSQLKIIEAGIHNMPIIASKTNPYIIDVIDGKHGFLIDENNINGWYEKIKYFSENKNAVIDMGHELNDLIKSKYIISVVNKKRADFLKSIVK